VSFNIVRVGIAAIELLQPRITYGHRFDRGIDSRNVKVRVEIAYSNKKNLEPLSYGGIELIKELRKKHLLGYAFAAPGWRWRCRPAARCSSSAFICCSTHRAR
jgi:hypothetical protein